MKYEVILLDVDNTLLDFDQAEAYALQKACEDIGYPYSSSFKKDYEYYNKKLWERLEKGEIDMAMLKESRFKELVEAYHIEIPSQKMSHLYMQHLGEATFEIEGAYEMCEALSKHCLLATMTNGISTVQRSRFQKSRLGTFMHDQFISEEIGISKPNPGIFEVALEKLQIKDKEKVLMIGDSLSSDMKGGICAGIDTCFYNPYSMALTEKVTYKVSHLTEIPEILGL